MSKTMKVLIGALLFVFLYTGCSAPRSSPGSDTYPVPMPAPEAAKDMYQGNSGGAPNTGTVTVDRMVIRNADLKIVVVDPPATLTKISVMAESMGGYVVNSNTYQSSSVSGTKYTDATITIRVPAAKLQEALTQIKANVKDPVVDVLSESVSGEDVTAQYTDLTSRLKNLEAASAQLTKLMEEAKDPEDVLAIFNELTRINGEIEVIKGQIKYYDESVAMSAVSVTLKAEVGVAPITVAGWKPQGVARDAVQALINAYQEIANGVIWLVVFCLPIALPVGLVVWFIVRAILKARAKAKAKKAGAVEVPATKQEPPVK